MSEAILEHHVHVRVLNVYIWDQMCVFRYLKTPDIILSLVSLKKLNWTHSIDTHCIYIKFYLGTLAPMIYIEGVWQIA